MYNYEGVFIWNIQISLLSRLLMSIRLKKKFTETDLRKCISFILVKNALGQNDDKKMFRKKFLIFCMFLKFKGRFCGIFSNSFFLLIFKQRYKIEDIHVKATGYHNT